MERVRNIHVKVIFIAALIIVCFGVWDLASAVDNPIVGKWGQVRLEHQNDGTWLRVSGTTVFNADGTGTNDFTYNSGGSLGSGTRNFTYTVTKNPDGSSYLAVTSNGVTQLYRSIRSDDNSIAVADGTMDPGKQMISVSIKMDPTKTYTNADLNFDAFGIGYDHDLSFSLWPGYYTAWSAIKYFDGMGNAPFDITFNSDGYIGQVNNYPDTYTLNADGSVVMLNGRLTGFIGKDERLAIFSYPGVATDWSIALGMRRGDKVYSTADLAGTWALVGFGDDNDSTEFKAQIGTLWCNNNGKCTGAYKIRTNEGIQYETSSGTFIVSSDGSIGSSMSTIAPYYAGAIGNNGDTLIANFSYDPDELYHRVIFTGFRCTNCFNLAGQMIPMYAFATQQYGAGPNIYLYDPLTSSIDTIKENYYESWWASVNSEQTKIVYTEETEVDEPYSIRVYDIPSQTSSVIATLTADHAAYFDGDGKILFVDENEGVLKKMDSDGSNITEVATPAWPYNFDIFWISPDREKIVIAEERQEGDYHTTHYSRLVVMNTDGSGRTVIAPEILGGWNMLSWKPDSSGFFYFYHLFDVVGGIYQGKIYKYTAFNLDGSSLELTASDLGSRVQNVCIYTKSHNLLSLRYHELYDGQTGTLIAQRSDVPILVSLPSVPLWTEAMFGFDGAGDIYFADLKGNNFRRFIENKSGDINNDGVPDISDVILVLRIALELDAEAACSDVNGDGSVDISDVILTLRMALGLDEWRACV